MLILLSGFHSLVECLNPTQNQVISQKIITCGLCSVKNVVQRAANQMNSLYSPNYNCPVNLLLEQLLYM